VLLILEADLVVGSSWLLFVYTHVLLGPEPLEHWAELKTAEGCGPQ
jgi:hypothetical protein